MKITTSDLIIPLILNIATAPMVIPSPMIFHYNQADWEGLWFNLSREEPINLNTQPTQNIEIALDGWFSSVNNAMDQFIPKKSYKIIPHPGPSVAHISLRNRIKVIITQV